VVQQQERVGEAQVNLRESSSHLETGTFEHLWGVGNRLHRPVRSFDKVK
jgi:hypothetical protein